MRDALQLLELGVRGGARFGVADGAEAVLEVAVAEIAPELHLGDLPLDVLAHRLEGAQVGIGREPVQRLLQAHPRLGVGQAGEHAHLLVAQAGDVLLEGDQVALRRLGFAGQLGELAGEASHLGAQLIAPRDQGQRHAVVVAVDGDLQPHLQAGELLGRRLQLARQLAAQVDHSGRGAAQRVVLLDAVVDRRFVDGGGVAVLAPADPLREHTADEIGHTGEDEHRTSFLIRGVRVGVQAG